MRVLIVCLLPLYTNTSAFLIHRPSVTAHMKKSTTGRKATPVKPTEFSRTAVSLFEECPRCFYLDKKLGIKRPPGFPFTLNAAVDKLMKAEYDAHRVAKTIPPLLASAGFSLIPLDHVDLSTWRNARRGIRFNYKGFDFYGACDDVWSTLNGKEWYVVDYKTTAKEHPVTRLDPENQPHHLSYQKQIAFYVWLMQQQGHPVSDDAFFVYSTGNNQLASFNNTLTFETHLIAHSCSTAAIPGLLDDLIACYNSLSAPSPGTSCKYCSFIRNSSSIVTSKTPII